MGCHQARLGDTTGMFLRHTPDNKRPRPKTKFASQFAINGLSTLSEPHPETTNQQVLRNVVSGVVAGSTALVTVMAT